jgi:uncharacterized membrane protein SpoIIM required for sporulation
MILDLESFLRGERPSWRRLEEILERLDGDPGASLTLAESKEFFHLYQRASADLARLVTFTSEPEVRRYLEGLVARAYAEIHETRGKTGRFRIWQWFFRIFPQTFRRHAGAFWLSVGITLAGASFGGLALTFDPSVKPVIMPFPHLLGDPAERVAQEESVVGRDRLEGAKGSFSAMLMTHNTKVSIFTLALGMTYGVGTMVVLFYNGVILGAVSFDYIQAGQARFLAGWLLPHGSVEIPAILIAGQAGLLLAGALIGSGDSRPMSARLRKLSPDLVTLIGGVALLLVWAGFVEAFLSQYHEPVFPYEAKIALGLFQLGLLGLFLIRAGLEKEGGAGGKGPAEENLNSHDRG